MGVLSLAEAAAQAPACAPRPSLPVLRSTTHLVQVNVIALDRSDQPVYDLTVADLVLTDDGKRQRISVFSPERNGPAPSKPRALPPYTFSNRWEDRAQAPNSVTVLLLDAVNTKCEDQAYAREQALRFVEQIQPPDSVTIYALGTGLSL